MKKVYAVGSLFLVILAGCNFGSNDKNANDTSLQSKEQIPAFVKNLLQQVSHFPDSVSLRLQLATAYDSLGYYKEAIIQIDSLTNRDSNNYGLWFAKGQLAENVKDTLLAIDCYTKAIKIYPAPDAALSLANLYAEKKNSESLLICGHIKSMGLGRETDADCAFIAGIYYARTNDKPAAIKSFDECIANNYTYLEAYIEKGLVYFDNKQYNEALNIFSMAASVNNLYADAYYYQARCYEMMNKKDSAVEKFQQSLRLDKNSIEANEALKRLGVK